MVSDDVGAADRLQLLQMTAKCSTKEELGEGSVVFSRNLSTEREMILVSVRWG